jgi:ribosome-associated protein
VPSNRNEILMKELSLEGRPFIELCDALKLTNLCESGGAAKHVIAEGNVKVDGKVELRKRAKILTGQIIEFNNTKIKVL